MNVKNKITDGDDGHVYDSFLHFLLSLLLFS